MVLEDLSLEAEILAGFLNPLGERNEGQRVGENMRNSVSFFSLFGGGDYTSKWTFFLKKMRLATILIKKCPNKVDSASEPSSSTNPVLIEDLVEATGTQASQNLIIAR